MEKTDLGPLIMTHLCIQVRMPNISFSSFRCQALGEIITLFFSLQFMGTVLVKVVYIGCPGKQPIYTHIYRINVYIYIHIWVLKQ